MGGKNESVIENESKGKVSSIVQGGAKPPSIETEKSGFFSSWFKKEPETQVGQMNPLDQTRAYPLISAGTQKIRVHESNGQIHFHDDDKRLKAYVPIGQWYAVIQSFEKATETEFRYLDLENKSMLFVDFGIIDNALDCRIILHEWKKLPIGPTLDKLKVFFDDKRNL